MAVDQEKKPSTRKAPAKKEPKRGVGVVAIKAIRDGKTNEEALAAVKGEFPDAKTKLASVYWYRNKLRSDGEDVLTERELKKQQAKKPATKRTAAKKSTSAKGVDVKKTTKAKPSAPLKAGATRSASAKSNTADDLKDRAINKARSTANDGKAKAGEAIGILSEMIENSAKTIDENVGEKYGDYARSAADSVSSFAEKVNAKDVDEMVEDAREFVRKKPAVAIGAAAVVGLLVARLIKSGMDDRS